MKKALVFTALVSVISVFILINCTGLASSTPTANSPSSSRNGNGNGIWSLLERGDARARNYFLGEVDVNAADEKGKTPLHYAAERRDAELAKFFISIGANTNALDYENQSPLGICVDNDDTVIAELLASTGANIHLPIKNNATAALNALNKNPSLFKALLTPSSVASLDASGKNVLHLASISGRTQSVIDILSVLPLSSASINVKDNEGKTALDYALGNPNSKNHMEIAEQLILSGANSENPIYLYFAPAARSANYNIRRNDGLAPIHYAVIGNYTGLFSFLLDKKVDVNIKTTSGATPLHEAVRNGNIEFIRMLINNGADVNARDGKANTPLHTGIPSQVHREIVTLLLANGADPNLRDEHGDTPLHIAIILNRSLDVIQAILGGGSDVYIRNIDGKTPLYIAIQEKREALIPVLLSYGSEIFAADNSGVTPFDLASKSDDNIINLLFTPVTINHRDAAGNTMLHSAVKNLSSTELIGRILDQRVIIDSRNRDGDTALHIAVRMNQRENGEFLISRGASIYSVNSSGESPLYIAFNSSGGLREWIINSATIIAKDGLGNNMLHYAAQWNLSGVIPVIIRNGVSIEEANATGETPLFFAIKTDSPPTIRTLIENNANLNARDTQGNSVLHAAVRWNAVNSTTLLVSLDTDINVHSLTGNTPLHDAVVLGMDQIETILINSKANLEVRNIDGNTPLMEAVRSGNNSSAEKLLRSGADSATRNIRGDTPLHLAVGMERYDLVSLLLGRGTSIHARNTRNRTPFQISLSISPRMASALLTRDRIAASDDMGNSALHIALQERAAEDYLRSIISQGARLNVVDNNGKTPLRLAVDFDILESAKIIADSGADPFIAAVDNKTPAEISFSKGEECIRALFSGRAINARDSSENTILHYAARYGTPQAISLLFELGANKTIRNISSELPVDIAVRWNKRENADILR
jgi:ankyrin repeat protein